MIELLLPLGLNKYNTCRILLLKCYIDNFVRLWSCIKNINNDVGGNDHIIEIKKSAEERKKEEQATLWHLCHNKCKLGFELVIDVLYTS
jgi:hypothetical protein